MKKIVTFVLGLCFGLYATAQNNSPKEKIALSQITNGSFTAQTLRGLHPMNDGESYTQLSPDGKRIVRSSFKTGKELEVLFDVDQARGTSLSGKALSHIDAYIMSPNEKKILLQTETRPVYRRTATAQYYIYDLSNGKYEALSTNGPQMSPLFSPDGNNVAFVRDNNLFVVKLLFNNAETQVTKDGKRNEIINGIPDWVNEEEFSTSRSFDFTADSQMLTWVRYDESHVPIYHMQMFKGLKPTLAEYDSYPGSYDYKYPMAGERNSIVSLHSYDLKSRVVRQLAVPLDAETYIPRIVATADANRLAVVTLNRHQSQMQLYMVNPRSGVAKLILRESNEKYLRESAYTDLRFYDENFAILSERSGYQHLYWYTLNGELEATLTRGNYEVSQFHGYDKRTNLFYFSAHKDSPLETAVYSCDKKGKINCLTPERGTHYAQFSKNLSYFVDQYSTITQAPITSLRNNKGKILITLIDNAALTEKMAQLRSEQEFFQFRTSEGVQLNGFMVKPRNFDPTKQYPVVMYQYSGPASQEVKNAWSTGFYPGTAFEQYLAQEGYIAVIVDGRGTGARGSEFEKCTYLRLGDLESKDQVEAALYLGTLPYVDKKRIAIWGWSFGGFNTMMAMTDQRGVFRCGVAVAAPSNWKYYDTVYTERYMRTPKENANYESINPMARVAHLQGHLLLMHGTADDNVHYRNCTEMAEALVQADKQFDMQIYTNRNHGIFGGNTRQHLFRRMIDYFNLHLK